MNDRGRRLVRVRDYRAADEARCIEIFARAWAFAFPHRPRHFDHEIFARETQGETVLVAVIEDDKVAAFSGVYLPEAFIHHLYVDPDLHKRGIGVALLEATVARAGGAATLKCQMSNTNALAFYRRLGWREVEEGGDEVGRWHRMASPEP